LGRCASWKWFVSEAFVCELHLTCCNLCVFDLFSLAVNGRMTARLPTGKSLLDIQREEAVRAERDRAAGAAAEMANSSAGWAKASGMIWLAVFLAQWSEWAQNRWHIRIGVHGHVGSWVQGMPGARLQ